MRNVGLLQYRLQYTAKVLVSWRSAKRASNQPQDRGVVHWVVRQKLNRDWLNECRPLQYAPHLQHMALGIGQGRALIARGSAAHLYLRLGTTL